MRMKTEKSLLACGLGLLAATTAIGALAQGGVARPTSDSSLPVVSRYPRANDLRVTILDGRIRLTGEVFESGGAVPAPPAPAASTLRETAEARFRPEDIPMAWAAPRSKPTTVDDAAIVASIASKLAWSRHADGLVAEVHTHAGRVRLRGSADTAAALAFAVRIASNTYGVVSVDNQLQLESTKPGPAQRVSQAVRETWVALKLKVLPRSPVDTAVAAMPADGSGEDRGPDGGSAAHVGRGPPITLAAKARDPEPSR